MNKPLVYKDECLLIGLDPKDVQRIANKIHKAVKEANDLGLYLMGGLSGDLRYDGEDRDEKGAIVVACLNIATEGGDASYSPDDEGINRGEI